MKIKLAVITFVALGIVGQITGQYGTDTGSSPWGDQRPHAPIRPEQFAASRVNIVVAGKKDEIGVDSPLSSAEVAYALPRAVARN
jgi:hypothetical protein